MKFGGLTALGAAVVLTVSGCSGTHASVDKTFTVSETVNGQQMRVDLAPGTSKGLAIWFHGQGGDANTRMNEEWLNALRINGWAVASSDFHGSAWGNDDAVTDVAALTAWASEKAGLPASLYVAGSMGGLTSLNSMTQGGHTPKCWYGTMPVVDQDTVGNVAGAEAEISQAYGGTVPPASIPARNLAKLPAGKYRVLSSPEDTKVPAKTNADVLVAGLKAQGREVSTLTVKGEHGDPSHFNATDLLAFAKDCR